MSLPLKNLCFIFCLLSMINFNAGAQVSWEQESEILTGADQTEKYLPYLEGKKVAIMANPTSIIGERHLVDSLQSLGVEIVKVFGPEHGFRGNVGAGVHVKDEIDSKTGIPIVSLYGSKRKPSKEDLSEVDLLIYDLQDVGCRFYTNINALARLMEACQEHDLELLILDRPNPNGYLIDGPVLDMKYKSGIGQFPLPMSHGLTVAEFALMANGEGWLKDKVQCKLKIIPVVNYAHAMPYTLPVSPSPNLNTQQAVLLYPSTCMFEGTYINHGRGTYFPFTVFGSPAYKGIYSFFYTPKSIAGMSKSPLFMDQECFGLDLRDYNTDLLRETGQINLKWIMELYKNSPEKEKFFDGSLSNQMNNIEIQIGSGLFRQQIIEGVPESEIRASWEPGLSNYKSMRKQYLLYP
ncbi:exo-beta-N-acetylmuramidase NamZ family protein [Cyclobacterium sediminis]